MDSVLGEYNFTPEAPAPPSPTPIPAGLMSPARSEELQAEVFGQFVDGAEQPYPDPVSEERDILAVVNFALERRNIRTLTEFAEWLQHVSLKASASGFRDGNRRHPEPPLSHIANYIRTLEADARRGLRV